MKKIIFVNFYVKKISRFPLGTTYLIGTVREKTDYIPFLHDENYYIHKKKKTPHECVQIFEDMITKQRPDYVVFTLYQDNIKSFLKYTHLIKLKLPSCKIIVGGIHPTILGKHLIKNIKEINILVLKEGELILSEILNLVSLKKIPNIIYRKKGKIIETKKVFNYNFDIDNIPEPSREFFDIFLYSKSIYNASLCFGVKPTITMILSRGCMGDCKFCVSKKVYEKFRVRNPKKVLKEIKSILTKYPYIEGIYFTDNFFNLKHPLVQNFLKLFIKEGLNKRLSLSIQTRLDCITNKTVKLLKETNCTYIGIGIESFSPKIQQDMNKVFSLNDFEKKNKLLNKASLSVFYYFIFNYPKMSFEDAIFNIKTIKKYKLHASIGYLEPLPSTEVYKKLVNWEVLPDLKSKRINWYTNFLYKFSKKRFWKVNKTQEKIIKRYIKGVSRHNFWYWFSKLPLKEKLEYVYLRTKFNPCKLMKSLWKNI